MTAENRLPDFIEEMVRSATDALTFTEGMDEKSFLDDIKTQRAVVMCLMIIGEAANRIVADFPDFARENQIFHGTTLGEYEIVSLMAILS